MAIVRLDTFRTLPFGSISSGYVAVGTPITHNWRAVQFLNNTDADVIFSADGINDNIFVPKGSFVLFDVATNSNSSVGDTNLLFALFTQFFVRQASTAATTGAVFVQGIFARGE